MKYLELLAPAKNAQIGIAAIDCGADAVYIAGPAFGARQAAGNPVEDIARLCEYASRYGARVYATVNTILYDDEISRARALLPALQEAGVAAFIVQDLAVLKLAEETGITIPLHASTQCSIRTPERAAFLGSLGFSRLVLERELSLAQIADIRAAVPSELEFFVHGALCVCYSGECYLSEYLAGRSANRGACAQACRSKYDLVDAGGKVLLKDKALLSLKDYSLIDRIGDLAENGVCSFKIEGRLKNISYVENVVRAYSSALDRLVLESGGKYARASFGRVTAAFAPDLHKTFNRDYTELFISGRRSASWSSMDMPKGTGELIGTVKSINREGRQEMLVTVSLRDSSAVLSNGDGFAFISNGDTVGFRGDVCRANTIKSEYCPGLKVGDRIFRTYNARFEKELEQVPSREIRVSLDVRFDGGDIVLEAETEDGRTCTLRRACPGEPARDSGRMASMIGAQLSKRSGGFAFAIRDSVLPDELPLLSASFLNGLRRDIAEELSGKPCGSVPLLNLAPSGSKDAAGADDDRRVTYKANIANRLASEVMSGCGFSTVEPAYELTHRKGAELMRTKYCIRYELGICPKYHHAADSGPLFLVNNNRRLSLSFDCSSCEMTVSGV